MNWTPCLELRAGLEVWCVVWTPCSEPRSGLGIWLCVIWTPPPCSEPRSGQEELFVLYSHRTQVLTGRRVVCVCMSFTLLNPGGDWKNSIVCVPCPSPEPRVRLKDFFCVCTSSRWWLEVMYITACGPLPSAESTLGLACGIMCVPLPGSDWKWCILLNACPFPPQNPDLGFKYDIVCVPLPGLGWKWCILLNACPFPPQTKYGIVCVYPFQDLAGSDVYYWTHALSLPRTPTWSGRMLWPSWTILASWSTARRACASWCRGCSGDSRSPMTSSPSTSSSDPGATPRDRSVLFSLVCLSVCVCCLRGWMTASWRWQTD